MINCDQLLSLWPCCHLGPVSCFLSTAEGPKWPVFLHAYTAGLKHTVLIQPDGIVVSFGLNDVGQCSTPPLEEGLSHSQVSAGQFHSVFLRSDGSAVVCGCNEFGQCDLPPHKKVLYTQVSAGGFHTVPLCCYEVMEVLWSVDGTDGTNINNATFHRWRLPRSLQSVIQWSSVTAMWWLSGHLGAVGDIPPIPPLLLRTGPRAPERFSYTQVSTGRYHTMLLRSDGHAVACGSNDSGRCSIPRLALNMSYSQVSAGQNHTMLLRSDGNAVACGCNVFGQCNIPPLEEGIYMDLLRPISAGGFQTVLLRSDDRVVACGRNHSGQCAIPVLKPESVSVGDCISLGTDLVLQLGVKYVDNNAFTLICSSLAGEEKLGSKVRYSELAMEMQKRIATALKIGIFGLSKLRVVLPDGQLLSSIYDEHTGATRRTIGHGLKPPLPLSELLIVQRKCLAITDKLVGLCHTSQCRLI